MSEVFSPEQVELLRVRLQKLVQVYLFEMDPDNWPLLTTQNTQQQRFYAKLHSRETLRQISSLQAMLRRLPRELKVNESEAAETAELIEDAKRRGAELRARLKETVQ